MKERSSSITFSLLTKESVIYLIGILQVIRKLSCLVPDVSFSLECHPEGHNV